MSDKKESPKKSPKPKLPYNRIFYGICLLAIGCYVASLIFWLIIRGDASWISSMLLSFGTGFIVSIIFYLLTNKRRNTEENHDKQWNVFTGFLEAYIVVRNSLITEKLKYLSRENDLNSNYLTNSHIQPFSIALDIFERKCAFLIESEGKTIMNDRTIEAKIHEFYVKKHALIDDYNAANTSQDIDKLLNGFEKEMGDLYEYIDSLKKQTEIHLSQMKTSDI